MGRQRRYEERRQRSGKSEEGWMVTGRRQRRQFQRFEAVTVRAAARVFQLERAGVVCAGEAAYLVGELAASDAYASREAAPYLSRAARHRAALPGIAGGSALQARSRVAGKSLGEGPRLRVVPGGPAPTLRRAA